MTVDALVTDNLTWALSIVGVYQARLPWRFRDEIRSGAMEGLFDAALRFDPSRGSFRTYARTRIRGGIYDALRAAYGTRRTDITFVSLEALGQLADTDDDPLDRMVEAQERMVEAQVTASVMEAVGRLPERERQAIELRYFRGLSLAATGRELGGITESRACQLCAAGIKHIRRDLTWNAA
jgi:RNA polymerase sigma factor (sigma-70 family)